MSRANPWDALPIFQQIINYGITIITTQDEKVWTRKDMRDNAFRIMESIMYMVRANEESVTKGKRVAEAWAKKRSQSR